VQRTQKLFDNTQNAYVSFCDTFDACLAVVVFFGGGIASLLNIDSLEAFTVGRLLIATGHSLI
jgi:hypothetical protein